MPKQTDTQINETTEDMLVKIIDTLPPPVEPEKPRTFNYEEIVGDRGFLHRFLQVFAGRNECPVMFLLAVGLATLAAAVGRSKWLPFGHGRKFPNIFALIVGQSGTARKSTALSCGRKVFESAYPGHVLPDQFSDEALIDLLETTPTAAYASEFRNFGGGGGKGYASGFTGRLLELYDMPSGVSAAFRGKDRNTEPKVVRDPSLSFVAASTDEYLKVDNRDVAGGFLGRLLVFEAIDEAPIIALPPVIPTEVITLLGRMLNERGEDARALSLTKPATELFNNLYVSHARQQRETGETLREDRSFGSRLDKYWLKIAILLAVSESHQAAAIRKNHLLRAVKLMEILTKCHEHTRSRLTHTTQQEFRQRVLDFVKARRECTMRDLYRQFKCSIEQASRIVESLEAAGELHQWKKVASNGKHVPMIKVGAEDEADQEAA